MLSAKIKISIRENYYSEEVFFLMSCNSETNHEGKIDYIEFVESYYDPAKSIGFNLAVLFTNLSEHMPSDVRLAKLVSFYLHTHWLDIWDKISTFCKILIERKFKFCAVHHLVPKF